MPVPPSITAEVSALALAVTNTGDLSAATRITIAALQTQSAQVITDIDAALVSAAGALDAGDPTGFAGTLPAALLSLADASETQTTLADMRGLVGRAAFNLAQAGS